MRWVCISEKWDRGAAVDMVVGTEHQAECWAHDREPIFLPCFQPLLNYKKLENLSQTNMPKIQKGNKNKATTAAFLFPSNYF